MVVCICDLGEEASVSMVERFLRIMAQTERGGRSLRSFILRRRVAFLVQLLAAVPRPFRMLDVGGTSMFWEAVGWVGDPGVEITLLNMKQQPVHYENLRSIVGDARRMYQFQDAEFDLVFSNSVIEHVGNYDDQMKMAKEVQRVGKRYFIQTPSYYFPLEPHFFFPFFQLLPMDLRIFLLRRFSLGWYKKTPDRAKAAKAVRSVRLLRKQEVRQLFPGARIHEERFCGLVMSFIAYRGW
jgi:hypothetical protein